MLSALRSLLPRATRRTRPAAPRLGLEALEAREVPAIAVSAAIGSPTVVITADATSPNNVTVSRVPGTGLLSVSNAGSSSLLVAAGGVGGIVFFGSPNGDLFRNLTDIPSTLLGFEGNDTLIGGTGPDTITGGPGNDALDGGPGVNVLFDSGGSFTLTDPAPGRPAATLVGQGTDLLLNFQTVRLTGSPGPDTLDVSGYSGRVELNGGSGAADDLFRLGAGPAVVDGGLNGPAGDLVLAAGLTSARFDGTNLLTSRGGSATLRNVERVFIEGTDGPDGFDLAGLPQALTVLGGGGDDVIRGGAGVNQIDGGAGVDLILPSTGTDIVAPGNDLVNGLAGSPLTPAELAATGGAVRVLLVEANGERRLNVFGPTGAGFTIRGDWQRSDPAGGAEEFRLTGPAALVTGRGDLPFTVPADAPVVVRTAADAVAGFGTVTTLTWTNPPTLTTTDPDSPLRVFSEQYGLDVTAPAAAWRVGLGRDILALFPSAADLPLNPAVPYLYFVTDDGFSATLAGRWTVGGAGTVVALDPSDPSLYLRAPFTTDPSQYLGTFDRDRLTIVGVSAKGLIPFVPNEALGGDTILDFAHLTTVGRVNLNPSHAAAEGLVFVDFNANGDSRPAGVTPPQVRQLLEGEYPPGFLFTPAFDVRVGVNGAARFRYTNELTGSGFPVQIGRASVSSDTNGTTFAGRGLLADASNPLSLFVPVSAKITGTFTPLNLKATVRGSMAGAAGVLLSSPQMVLSPDGVQLSGRSANLYGFGSIPMTGTVVFGTGEPIYNLTGKAVSAYDLLLPGSEDLPTGAIVVGVGLFSGTAEISNSGPDPLLVIRVDTFTSINRVFASFTGRLSLDIAYFPDGRSIGVVNANGTIEPLFGVSIPTDTSRFIDFADHRFLLNLPAGITISGRLNAGPAFADRSITERAAVGEVVTLRGRITDPDTTDAFILTVDWGDGTTTTHTFPPGSDGRVVEVTHRYTRPSPPGRPFKVVATWADPQGAGNSAEFAVEVVRPARPPVRLADPATKAVFRAEKLGAVRFLRADLDGDGVADLVALEPDARRRRLFVVSGNSGEILATLARKDGPQTVTLPGRTGAPVAVVVDWRQKPGVETITFTDPLTGDLLARVTYPGRGR